MGFSSTFAKRILNATINGPLSENFSYYSSETLLSYPVKGIYKENQVIVDPQTEQIISSDSIVIDIIKTSIPIFPNQNDIITRLDNGLVYTVKDIHEDGQGAFSLVVFLRLD